MSTRARPGRAPKVLFSALDAGAAKDIEPAFAAAGHIVVSNARNYRMFADVPLVIPEVNPDHLALIARQRRERGWSGAIVTNPNCSTVVLSVVLAALRTFGLSRVMVTTLQAVSGAGYPGVASLDILGNVIPAISGEEEKMESETQKILGTLERDGVTPHPMVVSATTTRVPVIDGHTESIAIEFESRPSLEDVRIALEGFRGRPQQLELPSAPPAPIVYLDAADRPAAPAGRRAWQRHDDFGGQTSSLLDPRHQARGARPQHGPRRGGRGDPERRDHGGRGDAWTEG